MDFYQTKIGLGCVTFGREIDQATSFQLIDHALANGITTFDTAAAYGNGKSEEILGAWLAKNPTKRNQVKIATKIIPPFGHHQIINAVEECLKRLDIAHIDLLYFHRWDDELLNPKSWLAIEELIFQGKIGQIGVSNFNVKQLNDSVNLLKTTTPTRISCIQNNHNLAVSEFNPALINFCKQEAIDVVTFSPLGAGFLTGKHLNGIAKGSRFEVMPAHQAIYFNDYAFNRLRKLIAVAKETNYSPAFLALAWATHQTDVAKVLIGGRNKEQLDLAIAASKFYDSLIFSALTAV